MSTTTSSLSSNSGSELHSVITALQRDLAQHESSTSKLQAIFEYAPEAMIILDNHGNIELVNSRFEEISGFCRNEIIGKSFLTLIPPRFRNQYLLPMAAHRPDLQVRQMSSKAEVVAMRRDGSEFQVEINLSPIYLPNEDLFAAVIRDITLRKQTEENLEHSRQQLRELSAYLHTAREAEAARIAREIHDELGQALTGLKMDVAWLQRHIQDDPQILLSKIQAMSELIDDTVNTVRKIATELRPGILDELGLIAAIEWQMQEFQDRSGVICDFFCSVEETTLKGASATAVFRILQETLTNISRHACASRVKTTLREDDKSLTLSIEDNGCGISPEKINNPKSIGLIGMQERISLHGGNMQIAGIPGEGTCVTISIPLSIR